MFQSDMPVFLALLPLSRPPVKSYPIKIFLSAPISKWYFTMPVRVDSVGQTFGLKFAKVLKSS